MNKKIEKVEKKIEAKDTKKVEVKKTSTFNKKKKKIKKNITSGIAYVYSTFNNTIISYHLYIKLFSQHILIPL